ncbi:MAG: PqqD family protein [Pseudomonadota bacterium]
MTSHLNFKIELAPHLNLTEMDGKWVLFSKDSGDFFGLNETAGIFLKLLLENDFDSSVLLAQKEFKISEDILRKDFLELVDDLTKNKLIKKIS